MMADPRPYPGRLGAWAAAARPASLPLAASPVLVGLALAARTPQVAFRWDLAALALLAALLMQLVTNLQNDVGFSARGGDQVRGRTGLPRATSEGWLRASEVRAAILGLCGLALALGLWLTALRGWPVLALGSASLLAALAYMGGPRPIAYTPWGEITVLMFFGPVAVVGTQWLVGGGVSLVGGLAGLVSGSLAAAALAVNNHRDAAHDALLGRQTFVVCAGRRASLGLFRALIMFPFLGVLAMAVWLREPALLLPLVCVPRALALARALTVAGEGAAFNRVLFGVFRLSGWFSAGLAGGLVLGASRIG
jgi:1,4-dihydroxy-2-naphthoate polyprenyltransferase